MRKKLMIILWVMILMILSSAAALVLAKAEAQITVQLYADRERTQVLKNQEVMLQDHSDKKQEIKATSDEEGSVRFPCDFKEDEKSYDLCIKDTVFTFRIKQGEQRTYAYDAQTKQLLPQPFRLTANISSEMFTKDAITVTLSLPGSCLQQKPEYRMDQGEFQTSPTFSLDRNGTYEFQAKTEQGSLSEPLRMTITTIDHDAPHIADDQDEKIRFSPTKALDQVHIFEDGAYFSDPVQVRVPLRDEGSGIAKVRLLAPAFQVEEDTIQDPAHPKEMTAQFILKLPKEKKSAKGSVSLLVEDALGNQTTLAVNNTNSNLKQEDGMIVFEAIPPTITVLADDAQAQHYQEGERKWLDRHISFQVTSQDAQSGIDRMEIQTRNHTVLKEMNHQKKDDRDMIMEINSKDIPAALREDGHCELTFLAYDRAGNVTKETRSFFVDEHVPRLRQFQFPHTVDRQSQAYTHFFEKETHVIIQAEDIGATSGIDQIVWYTLDEQGEKSTLHKEKATAKGTIEVTLPRGFRGYLYASAIDHVGHYEQNAAGDMRFWHSDGIRIEDTASHIKKGLTIQLPPTEFHDEAGLPLYPVSKKSPLFIQVQAENPDGIRSLQWSLQEPKQAVKRYGLQLSLRPKKPYEVNQTIQQDGVTYRITEIKRNLVTGVIAELPFHQDANQLTLTMIKADWCNHMTQQQQRFSMDEKAPTLTYQYDPQQLPQADKGYEKQRRILLSVNDHNFDPKRMSIHLTQDQKEITPKLQWQKQRKTDDDGNQEIVHMAQLLITSDGAYELNMQGSDRAGRRMKEIQDSFVIDTQAPKLQLDHHQPLHKGFSQTPQTVRVLIQETNFDTKRIDLRILHDGKLTFINDAAWHTTNDQHTLETTLSEDGDYTIQAQVSDRAGNHTTTAPLSFTIDQRKPIIEVKGIQHHSAYRGNVALLLTIQDTHLDPSQVRVKLQGASHKNTFTMATKQEKDTLTISFPPLPFQRRYDDLYTLTIEAKDQAGNIAKQTIDFSVNRFGSVYALPRLETGRYYAKPFAIDMTESNVSKLKQQIVYISINGESHRLDPDEYHMTASKGNWYQYRYHFPEALFEKDGIYQIDLFSKDAAGNQNDLNAQQANMTLRFGIDQSAPRIDVFDLKAHQSYAVEAKQIQAVIRDNLKLDKVVITIDGEPIPYTQEKDRYTFTMKQKETPQTVTITAMDVAGNQSEQRIGDVRIGKPRSSKTSASSIPYDRVLLIMIVCGIGVFFIWYRNIHKKATRQMM